MSFHVKQFFIMDIFVKTPHTKETSSKGIIFQPCTEGHEGLETKRKSPNNATVVERRFLIKSTAKQNCRHPRHQGTRLILGERLT